MAIDQCWLEISQLISSAINQPFIIQNIQSVSGGCINSAYLVQGNSKRFFIKLNKASLEPMFAAEFTGLEELTVTRTIQVPKPVIYGTITDKSFIVMEALSLKPGNSQSEQQMGQNLASLHKIKQPFYGWHMDNTIGSTEQVNTASDHWVSFWKNQRLGFQLSLAEQNNTSKRLIDSGNKLAETLGCFFNDYSPQPSLLHGDLWSGNASANENNNAILYDPACYYGDRETDIAMTELFGGFSKSFYNAYDESFPLHPNYPIRKTLYNLYHILNHLNLFGSSYLSQAQAMVDTLLSETS